MKLRKEGIPLLIPLVIFLLATAVWAGIRNRNVELDANIASSKLDLTAVAITGGSFNGTVGATTPSTGVFTTLSLTSIGSGWTAAGRTCADLGTVTTADINGGTADAVVIGGSAAAAGTFTTLTSTGGAVNGTVGATTPAAGIFTTLTTTGKLTITEAVLSQVDSDTDLTILATQSGKILTNTGAGVSLTFTLPTPAKGLTYNIVKVAAQNLKVVSGNTILGTTNNSYVTETAGSTLVLAGVSTTQWALLGKEGTWVDTTTLP